MNIYIYIPLRFVSRPAVAHELGRIRDAAAAPAPAGGGGGNGGGIRFGDVILLVSPGTHT